jgi:hypothetical protein
MLLGGAIVLPKKKHSGGRGVQPFLCFFCICIFINKFFENFHEIPILNFYWAYKYQNLVSIKDLYLIIVSK